MKSTIKLFGIIALVAVIGFSMAGCSDDNNTGDGTSLDGVWKIESSGSTVNISGSTGVYTQIASSAAWQDAVSKGYVKIGDLKFRNLTKTGDLTWTGQQLVVNYSSSTPNVATSVSWENCTITMNKNGQTFQCYVPSANDSATYTRQK